jgi:hypothetical protein
VFISATRIHHYSEVNGETLKLNKMLLGQPMLPRYLLFTFSDNFVLKVLINFSDWQQQKLGKSVEQFPKIYQKFK